MADPVALAADAAGARHGAAPESPRAAPTSMMRFVRELVRPYHGWLIVVFAAMIVETLMSLAAPWPLKLVLDDALSNKQLPAWLSWAHDLGIGRHTMGVALFAGLATLAIALLSAIATYIDNYYTTSIGQWVATAKSHRYCAT